MPQDIGSLKSYYRPSLYPCKKHGTVNMFIYNERFVVTVVIVMERNIDAIENGYEDFVRALAHVFEANELSGGNRTAATDAALEKLKLQWEWFKVACDEAEDLVELVKKHICLELPGHRATDSVAANTGQDAAKTGENAASLPPNNAVVLDKRSKAVGSGTAVHPDK